MNRLAVILIIFLAACLCPSCDKDIGAEIPYNTMAITSGDFAGYEHTFYNNLGFCQSTEKGSPRIHLVLGAVNDCAKMGENVMSIIFYDNGSEQVLFPGCDGQSIEFAIRFDDRVYLFREHKATLTIRDFDAVHFDGSLSGDFIDIYDPSRKISLEMNLMLTMEDL